MTSNAASTITSTATSELMSRYSSVIDTIASLVKTMALPFSPRLVAVSKTKPPALIAQLHAQAKHTHFGENYVSEIISKSSDPSLASLPICWHFIGHLQTNKIKSLLRGCPSLFMVESIDSIKAAKALNAACSQIRGGREALPVLVQVNTSGENSKSGCPPSECLTIIEFIITQCPQLQFRGLMTIGKTPDATHSVDLHSFNILRQTRDEALHAFPSLKSTFSTSSPFELSMGMSGDYEEAIRHGATNVRVGSKIFGNRDYSKEMKDFEAIDKHTDTDADTHTSTSTSTQEKKQEAGHESPK